MLYCQLANALKELSLAPRSQKAELIAPFIADLEPGMLCPTVRLLLGELWPPWETREMGVGPEGLSAALEEISKENISALRVRWGEMGMVAEASLAVKGQHSLSSEPLHAMTVYEQLRRISQIRGKDSEQRKNAIIRGLFQDANPLEGRYIARTVLGNMLAGIGHKIMLSAFVLAFHCEIDLLQRAYSRLPDPGTIAIMALDSKLEEAAIQPGIPLKPMIICSGKAVDQKIEKTEELKMAALPKYHSLRVQVHKGAGGAFVFSSRLRNINSSLNGLAQRLSSIDEDFIIDADLIGFQEGRVCQQWEIIRYINRRRLSRRSSISPALLAYDLVYLSGEDTTSLPYQERRRRLLTVLGEPRSMPFQGVSSAMQCPIQENDFLQGPLDRLMEGGRKGMVVRSLQGAYLPGECSNEDFFMGREVCISAVIIRAEYGQKSEDQIFSRFRIALRRDDDLVPVGWIGGQLGHKDMVALDRQLKALVKEWDDKGADVIPQVVLNLKIGGVRKSEHGYIILRPVVEEINLFASCEDADGLDKLTPVSCQ